MKKYIVFALALVLANAILVTVIVMRKDPIQESYQKEDQAEEILARVRTHVHVSPESQPTVATIVDVDKLRETNKFYLKAENGDHLIITKERAILYRASTDVIIDVVPVSAGSSKGSSSSGKTQSSSKNSSSKSAR